MEGGGEDGGGAGAVEEGGAAGTVTVTAGEEAMVVAGGMEAGVGVGMEVVMVAAVVVVVAVVIVEDGVGVMRGSEVVAGGGVVAAVVAGVVVVVVVAVTVDVVVGVGGCWEAGEGTGASGCGVETGISCGVGVEGFMGEGELGSPLHPSPSSELSSELSPDISPPFRLLLLGVEEPEASSEPMARFTRWGFLSSIFFGAGELDSLEVLRSGVRRSGVLLSGVGHSSVMSGVLARDRRAARCLVLISLERVRVLIRKSSSVGVGGGRPEPGGGSRGLVMTGRSP